MQTCDIGATLDIKASECLIQEENSCENFHFGHCYYYGGDSTIEILDTLADCEVSKFIKFMKFFSTIT